MWEAVFVYVDFSTAEINGVECFALVVFFGTFPPQVLTSLYRCSCLLSDKISVVFLLARACLLPLVLMDLLEAVAPGDASEMAALTGRVLHCAHTDQVLWLRNLHLSVSYQHLGSSVANIGFLEEML